MKAASSTNTDAFALATSLTLSTLSPFGISTSPFAFGNTVIGTLTVSVNLPLSYVTGTSTLTSVAPALPAVSGKAVSAGVPTVPPVPGVTAAFACSAVGFSPSNTTILLGVELTTVTGTSTSLVSTTLSLASLYSTTTFAGVCTPVVEVAGTVPCLTSFTDTVTPSGNLSVGTAFAASTALALTTSSNPVLSLRTVTPVGVIFGKTTTSTVVSTEIVSVPFV